MARPSIIGRRYAAQLVGNPAPPVPSDPTSPGAQQGGSDLSPNVGLMPDPGPSQRQLKQANFEAILKRAVRRI